MQTTEGASLPRPRGRLRSLIGSIVPRLGARRGEDRVAAPGAVDWTREWKPLAVILSVFLLAYYLPIGQARFDAALVESLELT
ncbi:MAG: hypothetical protein P8125_07345, partial [Gemmatimonadota bacterium]